MSEIVKTYMLSDPEIMIPMERKAFYDEQVVAYLKHGRPTRAVEIVNIFLFNEHGELIIQKRSKHKNHNPGLLDKSIGGHVQSQDTIDYTVMVETVQELQVPSLVLRDKYDFKKTCGVLRNYLDTIALMQHIDRKIHTPSKLLGGEKVVIANYMNICFGIYSGRVKNIDSEASGILYYKYEDLREEMLSHPDIFTNDLHILCEYYHDDIMFFIDIIKNNLS